MSQARDRATPRASSNLTGCRQREAVIVSLDDAHAWDAYEIAEPRLVGIGADSAVLVYMGRASRGDEAPFVALMSSIYTRVDGRWRLALYQQTPIPAG